MARPLSPDVEPFVRRNAAISTRSDKFRQLIPIIEAITVEL